MKTELLKVPGETIDQVWPHAKAFIARTDDDYIKASNLYDLVKENKIQLWIAVKKGTSELVAAGTTELVHYPCAKVCRAMSIGGDIGDSMTHEVKKIMSSIEEWALDQDCTHIEIIGRKGWVRVLPDFKTLRTIFIKRLGVFHG